MLSHTDWTQPPRAEYPPDFRNFLAVLERGVPTRPTLYEFGINGQLLDRLLGDEQPRSLHERLSLDIDRIHAWKVAGYDYAPVMLPGFRFVAGERAKERTVSLNEGAVVSDRASFDAYNWPDPDEIDTSFVEELAPHVPAGMKLIVRGPGGVLENAIGLAGFQNLCMLLYDDPQLVADLFDAVGSRLVAYYRIAARYDVVGACTSNDDWGFKSQTMLAPADMRRYVFPWHKQIVEVIHAAGKPAMLHSCGYFDEIIEDVIEDMEYDARHSYEDAICPVEDAYERFQGRIAVLGGIDVDFVCRHEPEEIYGRSAAMLERTANRGGYALGTGNSVPDYVPDENYFAMIRAAHDMV